ncbi:MAG: nitroreductase family protein [Thermoanaerobaculia bacterium]|nr:nitroreductase family protein [Thermoanaerobaculia bacterium]
MSEATPPIPDVFEAMATARSFHRYRFDPIPEADLARILWAATRAPSGTNRQPFRFIVLRDDDAGREARAVLADGFRRGWAHKVGAEGWQKEDDASRSTRRTRSMAAMQQFVDNFERIPVIVLACMHRYRGAHHGEGASVVPACQNLLLAARGLGYGACFSGWHHVVESELREMLGVPDDVVLSLTITLGRPEGSFGPVRRFPARQLIYDGHWGNEAAWVVDPPGSVFSRSRMKAAASYRVE